MSNTLTLYIGTDQVLRIPDVTDREGTPQEDATVRVTLRERDGGAEVTGMSWPATADHDADGTYELALSDALELEAYDEPTRTFNARRRTTEWKWPLEAVVVYTLQDGSTRTTVAEVAVQYDEN